MSQNIYDPVLGEIEPHDRYSYRLVKKPNGVLVKLNMSDEDQQEMIAQAQRIVGQIGEYAERAAQYACESLIDLKNETWRRPEEAPVNAAEFKHRLSLAVLELESDGTATFYFDDDQMFHGHSVVVYADADGEIEDAKLAG